MTDETRCPECGVLLGGEGNADPQKHLSAHWDGVPEAEMSKEAKERRAQLRRIAGVE